MKAMWNNTVIAEAQKEELILIEGNWYFPPAALHKEYFKNSDHRTVCPWKGEAHYFDVVVKDTANEFGAWYYPQPLAPAIDRVKHDFTNYVAFWNGITVTE